MCNDAGDGAEQAYQDEEVGVTEWLLQVTRKEAREHHAECHKTSAEGVVCSLRCATGEVE